MIVQSRIIYLIIFVILCHLNYIYSSVHPTPTIMPIINTTVKENHPDKKPIKQMLSMTFRNGEPLEYHKKRFGLFYRAKRRNSL